MKPSNGSSLKRFIPLVTLCLTFVIFARTETAFAQRGTWTTKAPDLAAVGAEKGIVALKPEIAEAYGKLPLSFEANQGQTDSSVKFLSRGRGYTLFLTRRGEALLVLRKSVPKRGALRPTTLSSAAIAPESEPVGPPAVLRMKLVGAKTTPQVGGLDELPGKANYFIGSDPEKWRTNVPTYGKVRYCDVYPGVDLVYYGNQRQLEHDFVMRPGGDPTRIQIAVAGSHSIEVDKRGGLKLGVSGREITLERPVAYQVVHGVRRLISAAYVLRSSHEFGFELGEFDKRMPLVIDPVLFYSTYLGGNSFDVGNAIVVDSSGNAYVAGQTTSTNFPTMNPMQASNHGLSDAFVAKLNATGSGLVYSTYLGGSCDDLIRGIALDASGNAYVTGITCSTDFPTANAVQSSYGGGQQDAFVSKLNASGSALVYSTYLGGGNEDSGYAIAVDNAGNAYVSGDTESANFPVTIGAFQTVLRGPRNAFVAKLSTSGSALAYATYLGGNNGSFPSHEHALGIAIDTSGNAYVTGATPSTDFPTTTGAFQTVQANGGVDQNGFVAKLNNTGSALLYSTYLGGNGRDVCTGIQIDSFGNAYVSCGTFSTNFPTTPGAFQTTYAGAGDAAVAKLNATGSALLFSTYLGGSGNDSCFGIALDTLGNTYVTGLTGSTDFPTANAIQATRGYPEDAFVTKVNPTGTGLIYSTYLGGGGPDFGTAIAVDTLPSPNAYVTGFTGAANFPTTTGAFLATFGGGTSDAFVTKIAPSPTTTMVTSSTNPSVVGQSITFTATVSSSSGTPTGTVTFSDGTNPLGAVTLTPGQGTFSTSSLGVGSHSITAQYSGDANFSASTGSLSQNVTYGVCALYDQTRSVQSGAVYPIKVALCDVNGTDVSSSNVVLHATAVTKISVFVGTPEPPGNANPDNDFRFDSTLGTTGGYIFNLSTSGLASGTYSLQFTATGDPVTHSVNFGVK